MYIYIRIYVVRTEQSRTERFQNVEYRLPLQLTSIPFSVKQQLCVAVLYEILLRKCTD